MVFKLIRIDASDARKIPLDVGKHSIGRGTGKFLQCDDKRVSRQHGELEVTDDSVILKALHTNPCFYLRKGTFDRKMLKQNESVSLGNGDKFGLLPADCWYEILFLPNSAKDKHKHETMPTSESYNTAALDRTEVNTEAVDYDGIDRPFSPNVSDQSQSLLQNGDLPSTALSDPSPSLQGNQPPPSHHRSNSLEHQPMKFKIEPADHDSPSPAKRPLPSTSDVKTEPSEEIKRIKTEEDAIAGSSNADNRNQDTQAPGPADVATSGSTDPPTSGAADASSSGLEGSAEGQIAGPANGPTPGPAMPPSPVKPARPRERCMYGANCYRKNEDHKKQFSHPSDSDWGPGERGSCPYGAGCRRRNPRHWRLNAHPPGTVPPAERQQGKRQRRKKKRESTDTDTEEDTPDDVIVTEKRARKKIDIQKWSDSEEDEEDPFHTDDEEDEWQPSGSLDQDTQYTQDD